MWQIRWAPCWERHRELWRRRRRLKPEAQSRADQHLRQPVAKLCKSLSPFLLPLSAFSFSFVSISSCPPEVSHINLQSIPHPSIDSAPTLTCGQSQQSWQNVRSRQHFQQRHTTRANSKQLVPSFGNGTVAPAPHKWIEVLLMCLSKQPEEISNSSE